MAPRTERCTVCKKPAKRNHYLICVSCKNNYCIDECSQVSTKRFDLMEKSRRSTWKCNVCIKAKRSSSSTPMKAKLKSKSPIIDHEPNPSPISAAPMFTDIKSQPGAENVPLHKCVPNIQTHNSFDSLSVSENCDDVEDIPLDRSHDGVRTDNFEKIEEMKKKNRILQEQLDSAEVQIEILLSEKAALLKRLNEKDLKITSLVRAQDELNKTKSLPSTPEVKKASKTEALHAPTSDNVKTMNTTKISKISVSANQKNASFESAPIHKHNDPIQSANKHNLYILGDDGLLGLSAAALESRQGKWNDQYKPTAFIKSGATSTEILEECVNKRFLDSLTEFDVVVLGVGNNDKNPTKLQSNLCIALSKLNHVQVIITPVVYNAFLNERLLNNNIKMCTQLFNNCKFIEPGYTWRPSKHIKKLCNAINLHIDSSEYSEQFLQPSKLRQFLKMSTKINKKKGPYQSSLLDYFSIIKKTETGNTPTPMPKSTPETKNRFFR